MPRRDPPRQRPAGPPPTEAALQEAALRHLARYAATEAALLRVLDRRIARWARMAGEYGTDAAPALDADCSRAREAARHVVSRLVASGGVSDTVFAESRARSLSRAGKSRRAVAASLAAKGVPAGITQAVLPEDAEAELAAALIQARKRRLGPFRTAPPLPETRQRELAALGRAGFSGETASRALRLPAEEAEEIIIRFRRA